MRVKKPIATHKDDALFGLSAPGVWDSDLAVGHLEALGVAKTRRTAERRIKALELLPPILSEERLCNEAGEPANRLLLDWALGLARKRRIRPLFAQIHHLPDETPCLYANDAREARFWVPMARPDRDSVRAALEALQAHIGKPIAVIPHGDLVELLRDVEDCEGIMLFSQVFPSPLPDDVLKPNYHKSITRRSPHLDRLEAESIHIIREAVAEASNPAMLYSIGKDSGVMLHLARKAFYPAPPPFPLLHVDTRWKFRDMIVFRDLMARESGMDLLVHVNPEAIEKNINPFDHGSALHTDITKTEGLKQALDHYRFDVVFGGARRDEEKSRAKERIFSFRSASHRWDPKAQRPELWSLYNTRKHPGESMRVFPLSNWTEVDIWHYIYQEGIPVVPLYFAKQRPVIMRQDMIMLVDDARCRLGPDDQIEMRKVRFRTLGCYPLTGAVLSEADSIEDILVELINARQSEREGRKIDTDQSGSMEKKKQEGYF